MVKDVVKGWNHDLVLLKNKLKRSCILSLIRPTHVWGDPGRSEQCKLMDGMP